MRCASTRLRRAFSLSPSNRSSTKHKRWVLLASAAASVTMSALPALAANLTWDASGTTPSHATDGAGSWDTTNVNWSNGTTDAAWNTAGGNTAVFGNANGAAGNVVIDDASGGVTATGLIFNAPGSGAYTISASGTDVLTLSGTNPSLLVRTGVRRNHARRSLEPSVPAPPEAAQLRASACSSTAAGPSPSPAPAIPTPAAQPSPTTSPTSRLRQTSSLVTARALGNTGGDIYIGYPQNTATGKTDTSSMALGASFDRRRNRHSENAVHQLQPGRSGDQHNDRFQPHRQRQRHDQREHDHPRRRQKWEQYQRRACDNDARCWRRAYAQRRQRDREFCDHSRRG